MCTREPCEELMPTCEGPGSSSQRDRAAAGSHTYAPGIATMGLPQSQAGSRGSVLQQQVQARGERVAPC